ncbi:MAG: hypothetical protein K2N72_03820, partial [Oscillospiraceae bacterium]|nr:hypothetical protein [Oscillospiraceae bacterium]
VFISALTIAAFQTMLLCGCDSQAETGQETAAELSEETAVTESVSTTLIESETEESTEETKEETVTKNSEKLNEPILLKARSREYKTPVLVFEDKTDIVENEEDFPEQKHIEIAREAVFNDEEISGYIEKYNNDVNYALYPPDLENFVEVTSPGNIAFSRGVAYDFDKDGEMESIMELRYEPSAFMSGCAIVYCDGDECVILPEGGNPGAGFTVMDYTDFCAVKIDYTFGFSGWDQIIYTFGNEGITPAVNYYPGSIDIHTTEDGGQYFICKPKYSIASAVVVCWGDGVFSQAETIKITEEYFTRTVENAGLLLAEMEKQGKKVNEIYTIGYYGFWLCYDEGMFYFALGNGSAEIKDFEPRNVPVLDDRQKPMYTNKNSVYGIDNGHVQGLDIWNLSAITTGILPAVEYESIEHPFTDPADIEKLPDISEITPMEMTVKEMSLEEVFESDEEYEKVMSEAVRCVRETENYKRDIAALKKSRGMVLLGGTPYTPPELDENYEPVITLTGAVKGSFDDTGVGYAVTMDYFDVNPEFTPYHTNVFVYIDGNGKGHILIEKGTNIRPLIVTAGRDYFAADGGINNMTGFFNVYDLRVGLTPIAQEWRDIKYENNAIEFLSANIESTYYGCFNSDTGKFGLYKKDKE